MPEHSGELKIMFPKDAPARPMFPMLWFAVALGRVNYEAGVGTG